MSHQYTPRVQAAPDKPIDGQRDYGCGCQSFRSHMVYCPLHAAAPRTNEYESIDKAALESARLPLFAVTRMSYNGWSNYETWNVALWIDNEPGTYEERHDLASRARSVNDLAASLKSWVEDMSPDLGASMFADLLSAALSDVDWYEIAENWYEEAHDKAEEEAER